MVVEVVNAFGSGVAGLSALPTCSLHPRLPLFTLTHSSLVCSLTHHDFGSVGSSRTGFWGRFWSHADSSSSLHELLSTHDLQIRVLPVSGASTDKNGAAFPHAGPPLSVPFLAGSDCFLTQEFSWFPADTSR